MAKDGKRTRVMVVIGAYLPGFKAGGPIRSIANLIHILGCELDFWVLTENRDLDGLAYEGIATNQWMTVGRAQVMYLSSGLSGFLRMAWELSNRQYDILYLNSCFARKHSMFPLFLHHIGLTRAKTVILAPRGEFSQGALGLKSLRKRMYIRFSKILGLYRNVTWQASTMYEESDIRHVFEEPDRVRLAQPLSDGSVRVKIAENLAGVGTVQTRYSRTKLPGVLKIVFLSRISPKKNLVGAVQALHGVKGEVHFDVYGTQEDEKYWARCEEEISRLPTNVRVTYGGELPHQDGLAALAEHHVFLFPTLGENFGHVIAEALSVGCLPIISDQTPWRNLEAEGVGWDIPLGEPERFRSVLQQCVDGDGEWFAALSKRAMNYAVKRASNPETIDANRELFRGAFARPA